MKNIVNNRASSKARNKSLTLKLPVSPKPITFPDWEGAGIRQFAEKETGGDLVAAAMKLISEGKKAIENREPPPNLKKIVSYEIPGVHDTADTLYWGGRWPDDFFLGRKCSDEPPKLTSIADVFAWLATIEEIANYGFVNDVDQGDMEILYHAASLELRLDPTPECANTSEKYAAIRARSKN